MCNRKPVIIASLWLLAGCVELKELHLPPLPEQEFVSAEVERTGTRKKPFGCFGYRAFSDSVIKSSFVDTTLTYGFIVPNSSKQLRASERKMKFGDINRHCYLHYMELTVQYASESYSMLDELLFPRTIPPIQDQHTDYSPVKRLLNGILYDSLSCDTIRFYFEHTGSDYGIDTTIINGYFRCGIDSFFIQPSFKMVDIYGKNNRDMYVLQGYSLKKSDSLLAFLLHAPNFRSGPDVLYLRRDLDDQMKMHFCAFFSLISRVARANPDARIF